MKLPVIESREDFERHFQSLIWNETARKICLRHKISCEEITRLPSSDHVVFSVNNSFVLKIYRFFRGCFEREMKALEFVNGKTNFKTPDIVHIGKIENFNYVLINQLPGVALTRADWLTLPQKEQLAFVSKLAAGLKQIHELNAESFACDWSEFIKDRAESFVKRQIAHGINAKITESLPAFIEVNLKLVPTTPTVFMHGDVHFGNLHVQKSGGEWQISGLFDFADSRRGFYEYDFLAVGLLMMQGQKEIQREFFKSYGYAESDLNETMRRRLMMLTMLYETSDLRRYALRLKPEAVDFSLEELERAIWSFCG